MLLVLLLCVHILIGRNRDQGAGLVSSLGSIMDIIPKLVDGLSGKCVVDVAVGTAHCLAATEDGDVYGWGRNESGQISYPITSQFYLNPTRLLLSSDWHNFDSVLCGQGQVRDFPYFTSVINFFKFISL